MLTDEKKLIERISRSEETAFREVFLYYYPKVRVFLSSLIKNEDDAKDLAQNLFLKLWMIRSSLCKLKSLGAYIYRMCRNSAIDYSRVHRVNVSLSEHIEEPESYPLDEQYFAKEKEFQYTKSIENMPEKRRQVFMKSRHEGKSYEEISREMGISKKTVENHINAALKQLRNISSCIALFL